MKSICWLVVLGIVGARPSRAVGEDLDAPDPADPKTKTSKYGYQQESFSLRLGGGFLVDYANYSQTDASEDSMNLGAKSGIRDLRALVSGHLFSKRLNYTLGYMLDVANNEWRFRQTGFKILIPELGGNLFVGRTKEGFSTNKYMVGYYGWFNERSAVNDAFLPILADGARWSGHGFGGHFAYNVGAYADRFSDTESFNKNDWQVAARAVWLPMDPARSETNVLHLAGEVRYAGANDGMLQYKSKPESFFAQSQAIDTGAFSASRSTMIGVETYYTHGSFSTGLEYFFNQVSSGPADDPLLHGGEVFAAYLLTGETHPYKVEGGFFEDVVPTKAFFTNGVGAWEVAGRVSYVDLDDGPIQGGRFLKMTPQLNWYLSETLRVEFAYGYSRLDRDGIQSGTHFFQTRVQLSIQ